MKKIFLLLSFTFALASCSKVEAALGQDSLSKIKERLGEKAIQARTLAASIKSLENKIGQMNSHYLEKSRQNHSLQEKLFSLKESLQSELAELNKKESRARELARRSLLEMQDEQDQNALLKKTILRKLIVEKLQELQELKRGAQELQRAFKAYENKLSETKKSEESLHALILDLESKKKDLSKDYISTIESKNEWEAKFENALAKKKAYASVSKSNAKLPLELIPPLEKFLSFKGGDKGITFKYDASSPIKATAGGKVVYSGELASYGKVIMLDHGQQVRSVILGDIKMKVSKGDQVARGQVIGYTVTEHGLKKSLYYEVRKKNVAQNTLEWLKNNQKFANI